MKSLKRTVTLAIFVFAVGLLSAQTPPPPNGGNGAPDDNNTPVGGGAPIGDGLLVLLAMGTVYGLRKKIKP